MLREEQEWTTKSREGKGCIPDGAQVDTRRQHVQPGGAGPLSMQDRASCGMMGTAGILPTSMQSMT
jgi:hypothetical protein